jgi:hypothetical protein
MLQTRQTYENIVAFVSNSEAIVKKARLIYLVEEGPRRQYRTVSDGHVIYKASIKLLVLPIR